MNNRVSYVEKCVYEIVDMASKFIKQPYKLLELYCGTGSIYTQYLAQKCSTVTGWDVDLKCEAEFLRNVSNSKFICQDTIQFLKQGDIKRINNKVNIISIDNPLGIYNDYYCEHFEIIDYIYKIIKTPSILAFNIVKKPYNINTQTAWVQKRKQFYKILDESLDLDYALEFYKALLVEQGIVVREAKIVCRELHEGQDYFYMMICAVEPAQRERKNYNESCY